MRLRPLRHLMRSATFAAATIGLLAGLLPVLADAAEPTRPAIRDFLGICGHTVQFRPELYAPVCSLVRDYHPVVWDLGARTDQLPPWPKSKNFVNWENVYGTWAKHGYRTNACLQFESVEFDRWSNLAADSAAYSAAFATRFGPSSTTPFVESVEIGNEPGKFSDEQFVVLMRAAAPALRKADPKLKIATCNLTTRPSGKYAKSVKTLQADPAILPAIDVLTIHTYAEAEPYPTWRRSYPEDPKLRYLKEVQALADWRDANAKGKAIWITEFGYDATTGTPNPKTEFAKWVGVTETQQAQWLVRSVLLFSAMPVERAYIYFFNDKDEPKLHSSSGITRNFKPKPSYYALAHLQATLGAYRFSKVLRSREGEVYAFEFAGPDAKSPKIVVAWSPTGSGRTTTVDLGLPVGSRITRIQGMPLSEERVTDGPIPDARAIPISESPVYLTVRAEP